MSKTLVEVLEENEVQLISSGNRYKASCPFHKGDREPSFTVYPTGTYFCFGCEVWGDAVKFLIDYKGMTMSAALDYCGLEHKVKKKRSVVKVKYSYYVYPMLAAVAEQYHRYLLQQTGALKYLQSRGLSYETISNYKLGYTDGHVLNLSLMDIAMGQEVGLLVADTQYEALHHRITIPNMAGGLCDFMIGRSVTHDRIKYLGLKITKPIYGISDLYASPILFVAEGQFDYLILRQWGYPAVVIGGTHLTKTNIQLLKRKHIIVVPDNDEAGIAAAVKLEKELPNVHILDYSQMGTKDVSEAAESPNAEAKFMEIVRGQEWITELSQTTLARWFPPSLSTVLSR